MKRNLTKFFNLIKKDKQAKTLTIIGVLLLFIFTIGYSLSVFTGGKNATLANIKVNDLSFNITTNSGESDDRILHLQSGKNEIFNVIITNLNKINTKYELIYDVCSDLKCSSILDSLPDGVKVEFMTDNSDELNGLINNTGETKKINLLTANNTSSDVYIRLNLNAGYEWNELELANQIKEYSKVTDIIAYVDGVEVKDYPSTCNYITKVKAYKNNQKIILKDLKVECDKATKLWKTSYTGFADKIEINFKHDSFSTDSWETIVATIRNGQLNAYEVGSKKEVEIDGRSYTVRVANNTTPEECNSEDFSQTACGFVVEFVDIISLQLVVMNSTNTNTGSWPATESRTYANGDFFSKLPSDLQKIIIDTKVITGYGKEDTANFISTDKIYLLSAHEVYEDGTSNLISTYDTAWEQTRQLDYYKDQEVTTTSNYASTIKKYPYSSVGISWWLRTPSYSRIRNYVFHYVTDYGENGAELAKTPHGFAPAFRIG